jgi:hypothetical protein
MVYLDSSNPLDRMRRPFCRQFQVFADPTIKLFRIIYATPKFSLRSIFASEQFSKNFNETKSKFLAFLFQNCKYQTCLNRNSSTNLNDILLINLFQKTYRLQHTFLKIIIYNIFNFANKIFYFVHISKICTRKTTIRF